MDIVGDINILAKRAITADYCTRLDVAEVPYFGARADLNIIIDIRRLVDEIVFLVHSV